jgi:hypothetical protein
MLIGIGGCSPGARPPFAATASAICNAKNGFPPDARWIALQLGSGSEISA